MSGARVEGRRGVERVMRRQTKKEQEEEEEEEGGETRKKKKKKIRRAWLLWHPTASFWPILSLAHWVSLYCGLSFLAGRQRREEKKRKEKSSGLALLYKYNLQSDSCLFLPIPSFLPSPLLPSLPCPFIPFLCLSVCLFVFKR